MFVRLESKTHAVQAMLATGEHAIHWPVREFLKPDPGFLKGGQNKQTHEETREETHKESHQETRKDIPQCPQTIRTSLFSEARTVGDDTPWSCPRSGAGRCVLSG